MKMSYTSYVYGSTIAGVHPISHIWLTGNNTYTSCNYVAMCIRMYVSCGAKGHPAIIGEVETMMLLYVLVSGFSDKIDFFPFLPHCGLPIISPHCGLPLILSKNVITLIS